MQGCPLSEAQQKLIALLQKAQEVIPFADDEQCNTAFHQVVNFASDALQRKRQCSESHFTSLDLEQLVLLSHISDEKKEGQQQEAASESLSSKSTKPHTEGLKVTLRLGKVAACSCGPWTTQCEFSPLVGEPQLQPCSCCRGEDDHVETMIRGLSRQCSSCLCKIGQNSGKDQVQNTSNSHAPTTGWFGLDNFELCVNAVVT